MKTIPQYEIPFRDGDTFALVGERGQDQARIEEERREAASRAAAARYFAKRHQLTFEQRHAELVTFHRGNGWVNCAHKSLDRLEHEAHSHVKRPEDFGKDDGGPVPCPEPGALPFGALDEAMRGD